MNNPHSHTVANYPSGFTFDTTEVETGRPESFTFFMHPGKREMVHDSFSSRSVKQ
jgi:hypothetical protein